MKKSDSKAGRFRSDERDAGFRSGNVWRSAKTYSGDVQENWNTEDYSVITENRFYEVTKEPFVHFSIDVDAASYSNMRRFLKNYQAPPRRHPNRGDGQLLNYEYLNRTANTLEVITEIPIAPWQPEHRLVHTACRATHPHGRTARPNPVFSSTCPAA